MGVLALANEHLLAPTLFGKFAAVGRAHILPGDVRTYLESLHTLNARRNASLRGQCLEIADAFGKAGLEVVFLKGASALFERRTPAADARMMRDIDVLVPSGERARAARVLCALGYEVLTRFAPGHHAIAEFARDGAAGAVDLHAELIDAPYILPAARVRARAVSLSAGNGNGEIRVPRPTDRILHHLLHAQIHHHAQYYRGQVRLNQLHDFGDLGGRFARAIDWQAIADVMAANRLDDPLHSYLLLAGELFGMAWPLNVMPRRGAMQHSRLVLLHLQVPKVGRLMVPLGNLRRGFAWHRMCALYGRSGPTVVKRLRHAAQFLHKKSASQVVEQIFRFE